jgi:hypothetical protein
MTGLAKYVPALGFRASPKISFATAFLSSYFVARITP